MADDDFQSAESGASETYPKQCSALRKNEHVMLKGKPCKIVEMSTSKTGKHGHAKVHLFGLDIFTGKKYEEVCPSTHNMEVPLVSRKDYLLIDLNDERVELLDDDNIVYNLPVEGSVLAEIKENHNKKAGTVTVVKVGKVEKVMKVKWDSGDD